MNKKLNNAKNKHRLEKRNRLMPIMSFMEMVQKGITTWDEIDDFIELWHKGGTGCSLHEYLGMSLEQYILWIENPALSHHISYV